MSDKKTKHKKFTLSRRAFLGGAAATLTLPFLESLAPRAAFASSHATPKRLVAFYVPNGMPMDVWTPSATGTGWPVTRLLQPLADAGVKEDVNVLSGLKNDPAKPDGAGDHAAGTGSFLTCTHVKKTEGSDIQNGISVDQVAANHLRDATDYPSLQLGMEGGGNSGGCDSGYSCAYSRNISWAGPQTPLPKHIDPAAAFDYLFGGLDPQANAEQIAQRRRHRRSILDYVGDDADRLKLELGSTDRHKLDEYLQGVRELERRIERAEDEEAHCPVDDGTVAYGNFPEKVEAMLDLMVLALQCDMTRVATFMLGNAGSGRTYRFLGVNDAHHQISHHRGEEPNIEKLRVIGQWEIEMYSYLLKRMKETPDVDGNSLLDNSVVFFSSEITDGDRHNHDNMPIILGGSGGGKFTTGRHIHFDNEPPLANLYISLLDSVGIQVNSFGDDGTGPLSGLT
jgi:hypothetical protein